jgi:hypothetical protein
MTITSELSLAGPIAGGTEERVSGAGRQACQFGWIVIRHRQRYHQRD